MAQSTSIEVKVAEHEQALLLHIKALIDDGVAALGQERFEVAVEKFEAALGRAPAHLPAIDVAMHNLLTARKQWMERLLESGDLAATQPHLNRIFALRLAGPLAKDPGFRKSFAGAYCDLGKAFYRVQLFDAALACVRRAIEIAPDPSYYVDLTNALAFAKGRARVQDYAPHLRPEHLGRHVFVACAPKSGSTFLKNLLLGVTGFRDMFSTWAALQNEQELDLPQLVHLAAENTVTQQHCRATEGNIQLMQAFGIRPVVLVRNIFDTAMSLRDFYDGGFIYSTFFEREYWVELTPEEKIDLLIDHVLPWYMQFLASWQRVAREGRLEVFWLTYEELTADPPAALSRVLGFYGLQAKPEDMQRVVSTRGGDRRGNRFNQGVSGRGEAGLSASQKARILALARHFPQTDFSAFGLVANPARTA